MEFEKINAQARRYADIINWHRAHWKQLPALADVYGRFSKAKAYAYGDCKERSQMICDELTEGEHIATLWDWGILSHNSSVFTYGALIRVTTEKGLEWYYHIETPSNRWLIKAE